MEKQKRTYQTAYIHGNTVRKLDAVPQRKHRQEKRRSKTDHVIRANRERALVMSLGYVIFLILATIATVLVCTAYIQVQSELSLRSRRISSLQSEVMALQLDNEASQKRIQTSVDLDQIKQRAIEELGMGFPEADQVVYFAVDPDDYMNQYQDIPVN